MLLVDLNIVHMLVSAEGLQQWLADLDHKQNSDLQATAQTESVEPILGHHNWTMNPSFSLAAAYDAIANIQVSTCSGINFQKTYSSEWIMDDLALVCFEDLNLDQIAMDWTVWWMSEDWETNSIEV